METKEYFEKVMQGFRSAMPLGSSKNQHRNGRSLRKYCQDEGIWSWVHEKPLHFWRRNSDKGLM